MKILRFVLPFLFVRNWYDGVWEFSRARALIFGALIFLVSIAILIAYMLQSPVIYSNNI